MCCEFLAGGLVDGGELRGGGFLLTVEDGVLRSVERRGPDGPWSSCIALPGLVQAHVHLGQTLFRGMAERRTLLPWLRERIWPLEASHTPDTLATSVNASLRELFSSGCTGLLDMGTVEGSGVTVDILRRSGARALVGNALMDIGPDWIARETGWLREESERVRAACGGLVSYASVPRFALSCSDDVWRWMAELPEGSPRATHSSESPDELDHPDIAASGGNVRYLAERGFLGPGALLAHCVHLTGGEAGLMASTGTAMVHCPWTNLKLGSGIADVPHALDAGVRVCLGSDGAPCNDSLDLAGDVRLASSLSAVTGSPSGSDGALWLRMATLAGAKALGWSRVGRLAPGWAADMVLLDPGEEWWEELPCMEDPLASLFQLHWPSRVRMTMAGGRILYDRGEWPTLPAPPMPLSEARLEVERSASALAQEAGPGTDRRPVG